MNINAPLRTWMTRSITVAGIAILLLLLWRQQSELARLKADYSQLQGQNLAAQTSSSQPQQVPPPPAAPSKHNVIKTSPIPHPSPTDKNRLVYSGTVVVQNTTGLVATLHFKSTKTGPLGLLLMSVRMPNDIDAAIQTIQPAGSANYEENESSVSENGRFATFQGILGDEKDVAIALGVSGPTRVFVKGSCGIPAIQLDIQPTNAVAAPFGG